MKKISVLVLMLVLTGCATPYKQCGLGGGYSDVQLNRNTFKVSFRGNGLTSADRVQNLLLKRSAELTLENGYSYFKILTSNTDINRGVYVTPGTIHSNFNSNCYGNINGGYGNYNFNGYGSGFGNSTFTPATAHEIDRYTSIMIIQMLANSKDCNAMDARLIFNSTM